MEINFNDVQDIMFQSTLNMSKEEFLRKMGLMRNPKGWDEIKRCPVCKKEIKETENGVQCSNFSIDYKESGKCYWHRYTDGLNYWSSPEEMFKVMCQKDPEFKKKFDEEYNKY